MKQLGVQACFDIEPILNQKPVWLLQWTMISSCNLQIQTFNILSALIYTLQWSSSYNVSFFCAGYPFHSLWNLWDSGPRLCHSPAGALPWYQRHPYLQWDPPFHRTLFWRVRNSCHGSSKSHLNVNLSILDILYCPPGPIQIIGSSLHDVLNFSHMMQNWEIVRLMTSLLH